MRLSRIIVMAAALLAVFSSPATAQEPANAQEPATAEKDVTADNVDCDGANTIEINACMSSELVAAESVMAKYLAASRERFLRNLESGFNDDTAEGKAEALANFGAAQENWRAYRESHCGSVYYYWRGGTIRGAMYLGCSIDMAKKRTWQLWQDWLTYPDSTPPILPEPDAGYRPVAPDTQSSPPPTP